MVVRSSVVGLLDDLLFPYLLPCYKVSSIGDRKCHVQTVTKSGIKEWYIECHVGGYAPKYLSIPLEKQRREIKLAEEPGE